MGALRRWVAAADDVAAKAEYGFLAVVHGAICVLVVAGVVLRYGLNDPLTWGEELIVGLFTWLVFVGAAAAIRTHMHIRIDVLAPVFAHPKMAWLGVLTVAVGFAIFGVMAWASVEQLLQEAMVETPMLGVSKAWFVGAMLAGLVLMVLHAARLLVDGGAARVFRGETETIVDGD